MMMNTTFSLSRCTRFSLSRGKRLVLELSVSTANIRTVCLVEQLLLKFTKAPISCLKNTVSMF